MYVTRLLLSLCFVLSVFALEELETGWKTLEKLRDDFVCVSYPKTDSRSHPRFVSSITKGTVPSSGRNYTLYMGLLLDGLPSAFTLELPLGGKLSLLVYATHGFIPLEFQFNT